MTGLHLASDADAEAALRAQVRDLTERLERERARSAGLERGLSALSERVGALRDENAELRRRLEARGSVG